MTVIHTAHLTCSADVLDAFTARLLKHAANTLAAEPGCRAFDVHQEAARPTLFFLYEVYDDDDALAAHRRSPHYLQFREDTKDWVVERKWWFWRGLGPQA